MPAEWQVYKISSSPFFIFLWDACDSYSLRRMDGGGLEKAWESLIRANDRFPNEMLIPYNLACYKCQLGDPKAALDYFKQALAKGTASDIIAMAKKDTDLTPILASINRL